MKGSIVLTDIRIYAYHGCLPEEAAIGSEYRVDLEARYDLSAAMASDELRDSLDYVWLNRVVTEEMKVRSKLLEHVTGRIMRRLFAESKVLEQATVSVTKLVPPIGGDVREVTVSLSATRDLLGG